jgi:hypothetical protein
MQGIRMVRVDRQRLLAADLRLEIAFGAQMADTFRAKSFRAKTYRAKTCRAKTGRTEFGRRKAWARRGRRGGSPAFATIHLHFPRPREINL